MSRRVRIGDTEKMKCVSNDVAKGVESSRNGFMSAFEEFERINAEIVENRERRERIEKRIAERLEAVEELRKRNAGDIAEYSEEKERVNAETAAKEKANDDVRAAKEVHENWETMLRNVKATDRPGRGMAKTSLSAFMATEPTKPENITVPEITPINGNVEARGLRAIQELAEAMNDCAVAVAERRGCDEREGELLNALDEKEVEMLEMRKVFEQDVNKTTDLCASASAREKARRDFEIKALKQTRDAAIAGLKARGVK